MSFSSDSHSLLDIESLKSLKNIHVAIIATEWNEKIVAAQISGAISIAQKTQTTITHQLYVPGCFELPFACNRLYEETKGTSDAPQAIIAFGAVIRGGTPHFDYVCKAVTEGIVQLNVQLPIPVIFGVLTLDNEAQAWERLGGAHGHKGEEAMITAIKMVKFNRELI